MRRLQGGAPVIAAVLLTLLTRWLLLRSLAPALFSPEELFNAELAVHLVEHGQLHRPLATYQYTAHAGGSLVVSLLHVPLAWLLGPSELSLKLVALGFAGLTSGLWTAAALRLGRLPAWLMAMVCVIAPLHLVFRQLTALGNHAEALALMGGAVLLLQRERWIGLGVLLGFAVWFDRAMALFAVCCLPAVPPRQWWRLIAGAAVGALPMLAQTRFELPGASFNSQFSLHPRLEMPLLPPLTGGPRWPQALLCGVGLIGALAQRRADARACAVFVLSFMAAWSFYTARNLHVQTLLTLPTLFCAVALAGRMRLLGVGLTWLVALASTMDLGTTVCPDSLRAPRIDGLALARANVWWYLPSQVEDLQRWLDEGAPDAELFGRYFQYSADSPGLFTWRFFGAIGPEGTFQRDICFADDGGLPTVEQVDEALGLESLEPGAVRAKSIRQAAR